MVGRMQYAPTTGYVCPFEIPMRSPDWVRVRVQKMDLYTSPSVAYGGAYAIRPYDRVRAILRNIDAILQLGTCGSSKNHPVFVPFGAVCGAYALHSYDWVCAILQNTDAILQLGTCEGSKNGSVYATVGGVWWGVCNTSLRPGTCGPSKNYPVFVSFGAVEWGVFDTPLRPGTCDPPKYRCDPLTGYVRGFKK